MSDIITFTDCCRMILEQGLPVRQPVFPERQKYRRHLLVLLSKEFGIVWNDTDDFQPALNVRDTNGNYWRDGVPYLATDLVRGYNEISDPFSGLSEYTFVMGEMEIWKAHKARIVDAAAASRQCFVAFFRDLLLLRWPEAAYRTTNWARLKALGLVVPVDDPDDFL